ncbi:MAG: radical SAM protein [Victivallaceae bacterium]|nr:radical SAM protein [Victivallaceae bacterium]
MLDSAHFQLTKRCNLACIFCGQSRGMVASEADELTLTEWLDAAEQLRSATPSTHQPKITLWGGEPLLWRDFDRLAEELFRRGFKLDLVTNGTMLDRHAEVVSVCFERIFVSLDGYGAAHDAVRGDGVFARVAANLELLRERRGKLVFLTTVSDANVEYMAELPQKLASLKPDAIVLQQLMYLAGDEVAAYREFSRANFKCDYPELAAWERTGDTAYLAAWRLGCAAVATRHYPVEVYVTPHAYPDALQAAHCEAAWHRVHIRHDGEVGFCTDYFGFSAGNIKKDRLLDIFNGERAELFRRAVEADQTVICRHCPWRLQKSN